LTEGDAIMLECFLTWAELLEKTGDKPSDDLKLE